MKLMKQREKKPKMMFQLINSIKENKKKQPFIYTQIQFRMKKMKKTRKKKQQKL